MITNYEAATQQARICAELMDGTEIVLPHVAPHSLPIEARLNEESTEATEYFTNGSKIVYKMLPF